MKTSESTLAPLDRATGVSASDHAMAQALLEEFEREIDTTRRFLERIPEDRLTWQPHEKSMTAGQLALHIARIPAGVLNLVQVEEAIAPDFNRAQPQPSSRGEVLKVLDESAAAVRQKLPAIDDRRMRETFKVVQAGRTLMAMPRHVFLRSILLNHWYHHRGQLGVYLRLLGAKVPSSYGPSGHELPPFASD